MQHVESVERLLSRPGAPRWGASPSGYEYTTLESTLAYIRSTYPFQHVKGT